MFCVLPLNFQLSLDAQIPAVIVFPFFFSSTEAVNSAQSYSNLLLPGQLAFFVHSQKIQH